MNNTMKKAFAHVFSCQMEVGLLALAGTTAVTFLFAILAVFGVVIPASYWFLVLGSAFVGFYILVNVGLFGHTVKVYRN